MLQGEIVASVDAIHVRVCGAFPGGYNINDNNYNWLSNPRALSDRVFNFSNAAGFYLQFDSTQYDLTNYAGPYANQGVQNIVFYHPGTGAIFGSHALGADARGERRIGSYARLYSVSRFEVSEGYGINATYHAGLMLLSGTLNWPVLEWRCLLLNTALWPGFSTDVMKAAAFTTDIPNAAHVGISEPLTGKVVTDSGIAYAATARCNGIPAGSTINMVAIYHDGGFGEVMRFMPVGNTLVTSGANPVWVEQIDLIFGGPYGVQ